MFMKDMFYCISMRNSDGNVDTILIETELNSEEIERIFDSFKKDSEDIGCDIQNFPGYLVKRGIPFRRITPIKLFFTEY